MTTTMDGHHCVMDESQLRGRGRKKGDGSEGRVEGARSESGKLRKTRAGQGEKIEKRRSGACRLAREIEVA
jgi:hypothetical protein